MIDGPRVAIAMGGPTFSYQSHKSTHAIAGVFGAAAAVRRHDHQIDAAVDDLIDGDIHLLGSTGMARIASASMIQVQPLKSISIPTNKPGTHKAEIG